VAAHKRICESIRSERALVEHIDFNMMFRWFVGLTLDEAVWDHSTFSANRERLLKESVMREFFGGVVAIAAWADLVSDEHFSVDGSLLRAWASHKSLMARDGSDEPPGPDQGRNPEVDFRGQKRANKAHVSRTDPQALLASKGGAGAYLSFTTHALAENRNGLIVDVHTTQATGTAEREATLVMVKRTVKRANATRKPTLAAGRGYDTAGFIAALKPLGVLAHVAAKTKGSAVPVALKATVGYAVSLRRRKMIEEAFGWVKDIGTLRRLTPRRSGAPRPPTRDTSMPRLTSAQRRATCIHEGGHAVVFALGGVSVYRLAVADEGAEAWRTDIRNGRLCTGLWGLCEKADLVLPRQFMRWLMNEGCLHPDGKGHQQLLQRPEGRAQVEAFTASQQREIRAQMVGLMAGPAAEQIFSGEAVQLCPAGAFHEVRQAEDLSWLLPARDAFAHAAALTAHTLRQPEVWAAVERLADALARAGTLTHGLRGLLPAALPGWPAGGAPA